MLRASISLCPVLLCLFLACMGAAPGPAIAADVQVNGRSSCLDLDGNAIPDKPSRNVIILRGGKLKGHLIGGYSDQEDVTGNSVRINGGEVSVVYGALSVRGRAAGNRITLSSGKAGAIYGGEGAASQGNGIVMTGGTAGELYGGLSGGDTASATGNTVTVTGGTAQILCGGTGGDATGNTVTISGAPRLDGARLLGGRGSGDVFTRNMLNVLGFRGRVLRVAHFEHLNFMLPPDMQDGGTLLTVEEELALGDPATGRKSTVSAGMAEGGRTRRQGEGFTLVRGRIVGGIASPSILFRQGTLVFDAVVEADENGLRIRLVSGPRQG